MGPGRAILLSIVKSQLLGLQMKGQGHKQVSEYQQKEHLKILDSAREVKEVTTQAHRAKVTRHIV